MFSAQRLFFAAVLAALFTGASPAQSTFGSFVGTVKDPSAALVVGCTVVVRNTGTSTERSTVTDSTGSYTVVNLEPGNYEITMEMPGFQKAVYNNLPLLARQTVRVDGSLVVGTQNQTVEISTAREAPIHTERSHLAG